MSSLLSDDETKDLKGGRQDVTLSESRCFHGESQVFASGANISFYEPITRYEGRHRYDPSAVWEEEEERRLVSRIDWRICAWVCLMFFALQLDRSNLTQALSDNMLSDLALTTNDYNLGMTVFYVCFLSAELPSQIVSKKLGPDVWIPIQMVAWSVVAMAQCSLLPGRSGFLATRALLGLLEGGFIPDCVLYLTYFYKGRELPVRLGCFWGSYIGTNIVSAFLAYGILHLRGSGPEAWAGWRWLFLIEGALTAAMGAASWFYLPSSPTQTRGWFSESEEVIMVNRVLRDDPSKGDMHNRQGLTPRLLLAALADHQLWPVYLLGLTWQLPAAPVSAYITLNLKALGFEAFTINLLTVPAYVLFLGQLIFWTWLSERVQDNRFLVVLASQIWMLPLLVAFEVMPSGASHWAWYACSALLMAYPYPHAILVGLTSRNAGSVRTRTVASAVYNMCVQAGSIAASNIYRDSDKPLYRRGNRILLGVLAWNLILISATKYYYARLNAQKAKAWDAMSKQQKNEYLTTTKHEGNKRLDFRYAH